MVGVSSSSFAEKMQQLLEQRVGQQPLPSGFMRCPLNPAHQVPVAAIVRHMEKAHQGDALALAPNAMYSSGTYARRHKFIKTQLRCCYEDNDNKRKRRQSDFCCNRSHVDSDDGRCRHCHSCGYSGECLRSSSRSSSSSQVSLPSVKAKKEYAFRRKEKRQNLLPINNNSFLSTCNGEFYPQLAQPTLSTYPPSQQPHVSPVVNWYGGPHQQTEMFVSGPETTLLGRYTPGCSIEWQSIISYMLQFGCLRRCESQPLHATFTAEYDTVEAASRCLLASCPFVIIDGVRVELTQLMSGQKAAPATMAPTAVPMTVATSTAVFPVSAPVVAAPPSVFQTYAQAHPPAQSQSPSSSIIPSSPFLAGGQQHYDRLNTQPPVIKVAGKPVGVALLSKSDGGRTTNDTVLTKKNRQIKLPKCVVLATLNKSDKGKIDERCLFEEFVRYGKVTNIIMAGPRIMVEYASHQCAENAAMALKINGEKFSLCSYLNEHD